jgi:hypothetical protein
MNWLPASLYAVRSGRKHALTAGLTVVVTVVATKSHPMKSKRLSHPHTAVSDRDFANIAITSGLAY